jgi:hypothetical protein
MLLIWESQHASPKSLDPILLELAARWRAGTLLPDHKRRLLSLALTNQRDLSRPWNEGWGDLFDLAGIEKLPTEGEKMAFESHSAIPKLRIQPETKPGRRIRYYLATAESRQSASGGGHLKVHVLSATLNGVPLQRAPLDDAARRHSLWGVASLSPQGSAITKRFGGAARTDEQPAWEWLVIPEDVPPGDAEIVLEVAVRTFRGSTDPKVVQEVEANQQRAILRNTIKILQPDAAAVGVVPLDATTRTKSKAFFESITWKSKPSAMKMIEGSKGFSNSASYGSTPDGLLRKGGPGLFADIFILSASGERQLFAEASTWLRDSDEAPRVMIQAAAGSTHLWLQALPDPLTIVVVLRPERARELDPPGEGYGGEEIVIENATVDRQP